MPNGQPPSGHLFLLIGPSGSGKTTLVAEMCKRFPGLRFLPTTTTRPARPGEQDGREYYFVDDAEFDELIRCGDLLEWQRIHGYRYGTRRLHLAQAVDQGILSIMSVDILGGLRVRESFPDNSTAVFIRPSSASELRERLLRRGDTNEEDIAVRLARVAEELRLAHRCDFQVVNDDGRLAEAIAALADIIVARLPLKATLR